MITSHKNLKGCPWVALFFTATVGCYLPAVGSRGDKKEKRRRKVALKETYTIVDDMYARVEEIVYAGYSGDRHPVGTERFLLHISFLTCHYLVTYKP